MRQRLEIIMAVVLAALALAGCGSSAPSATPVAEIAFKSPAINRGAIPVLYTCDGKDIAPPLEWGTVPAGTGELALFILGFTPGAKQSSYKASVEWAVSGLSPTLHKLTPGVLPAGAHLGRTTGGKKRYSICPKGKKAEQYQFELYAIGPSVAVPANFVGMPVVAALANPKESGTTLGHGGFIGTYQRSARHGSKH